jgi:hypothetical protein
LIWRVAYFGEYPKFDPDQTLVSDIVYAFRMPAFLFTCPITRAKVQDWSDDDLSEDRYSEIVCKACNRLHYVNPATVLGQRGE